MNFITTECGRKLFFMPRADKQQGWLWTLDGIFIEKFDTAQGDSTGAAAPFFYVFAVQEIIAQILFGNLTGGFAEMFTLLLNGIDIKTLSAIAVAFESQVFDQPLSEGCQGIPPFLG
jgi:hypothetical protein